MGTSANSGLAGPVDHLLIESIEAELGLAMARAVKLETDAENLANIARADDDTAPSVEASLDKWESQLAGLARTAADAEIELDEQEAELHRWFEALVATRARLEWATTRSS